MKLYLGNIPFSADEDAVRDFFSPLPITKVTVCVDRDTGKPKGYAFVEFEDGPKTQEEVISEYHFTDFGGRQAVVAPAKEKYDDRRRCSPQHKTRSHRTS